MQQNDETDKRKKGRKALYQSVASMLHPRTSRLHIFLFILLLNIISYSVFAQLESKYWYFGVRAGIEFTDTGIVALTDFNSAYPWRAVGAASISDEKGNLLFFSDGLRIYNKEKEIMKNGTGLFGEVVGAYEQNVLITPWPKNKGFYYVFTICINTITKDTGLYYSIVDMSKDSNRGEVILKNNLLLKANYTSKMNAIIHSNGSAIWLVTHEFWSDKYISYLIDQNGLHANKIYSQGSVYMKAPVVNKAGYIKISPDAGMLVNCVKNDFKIEICRYNNTHGAVYDCIEIPTPVPARPITSEFSPSGKYLYIGRDFDHSILRYDMSVYDSAAIKSSEMIIGTNVSKPPNTYCYPAGLQLGMDGKIYVGSSSNYGTFYLGAIQFPDKEDTSGNYVQDYLYLKGRECGTGLPSFIQSYFFIPEFNAEHTCLGDTTLFSITDTSHVDSVLWDFGDTNSGLQNFAIQTNPYHIFSDTGMFKVQVFLWHDAGEIDTLSREIRISPYPYAAFNINEIQQCFNENKFVFRDTTSILSGGFSWEWDFGDKTKSYDQHPVKKYAKADSFKVSLTVLSDYGCESKASKMVYVYPSPQASFTINDTIQCFNEQLFVLNFSKVPNFGKVSWDLGDSSFSTDTLVIHTYKSSGTYPIQMIIENSFGCTDTAVQNVTLFPSPKASFTINDTIQCENEQLFEFVNTSTVTGDSISDLLWILGTDSIRNQQSQIRNDLKPGTWNLELIVTTTNGCTDTMTKQITVHPSPKAYFTINDSAQCENEQFFEFTNTSTITGDSISDLLWIFGTDSIRNSQSAIRNSFLPGTWNMKLITTSSSGCSDTSLQQIIIHPSPKASFTINDTIQCENEQLFEFTNTSTVTGDSISELIWILGTDTMRNAEWGMRNDFLPGMSLTQLIVTTSNGCTDSMIKQIAVFPSPKASFTINNPAQCENEQLFEFTNTSTVTNDSISELIWVLGTDTTFNLPTFQLSNLKPETWNLKLIATTTNACSDTSLKQILVHPAPLASFSTNDSAQCLKGNRFEFTNTSTLLSGTMNHQWTFGDIADTITTTNPVKTYDKWQKYEVQLNVSSDHNCTDTFRKTTFVLPMPLTAFIYLNNCLEDTMWFFDRSTIDSGEVTQWLWDFRNGNESTLKNPWQMYSDSGEKSVKLISTSDFGCSSDTTRYFYIEAHVTEPFLERATVENNEFVLLEWLPPARGNPMTYHLEKSTDGSNWQHLKDQNRNTFSYNDPQAKFSERPYYYRIHVTDSCEYIGPYSNIGKTIHLTADTSDLFPVLTWTPYELWVEGVESYVLQVKGWGDFQTVIEIPQSAIPNPQSAISQIDSFYAITGKNYCYRVIAYRTGDKLQSVSNEVCIPTAFRLFVPNAFSPNHDGINDVFMPVGIFIKEYNMQIYSRWGEKIFESDNIHQGWDGKYKNDYCPAGVYVYQIVVRTAEGKNKKVTGSVHLLR